MHTHKIQGPPALYAQLTERDVRPVSPPLPSAPLSSLRGNASDCTLPQPTSLPPPLPPKPAAHELRRGVAPADGDCFFHSVIRVAREPLMRGLGLARPGDLTPASLRKRIAKDLIDRFIDYNREVMRTRPDFARLMRMPAPKQALDPHDPQHQIRLFEVFGAESIELFSLLTPDQQQRVFDAASSGCRAGAYLARCLTNDFVQHNIDYDQVAADLLPKHPVVQRLAAAKQTLDLQPEDQDALFSAIGAENIELFARLTPGQQQHVFNVARSGSWNNETCDLMPELLVASFPGLRLGLIDGPRTHVLGHGDGPVHSVFLLDGNHYVPALA